MKNQAKQEIAKEAEELSRKIHNLEVLLQTDKTLIGDYLELLEIQFEMMCGYHEVLMERISLIDPHE